MTNSPAATHLLLVEDDDIHAHLVQRNLRNSRIGGRISHVDDGEKALRFLRREGEYADADRPDLILLDLKLPKVSGHDVLAAIKQDPSLSEVPVVMLTTSSQTQDVREAYARHVNSYVVKPLKPDGFRELLAELDLYWGEINQRVDRLSA